MEIKFNEVDVAKLNLTANDILVVSVKSKVDDTADRSLELFANSLRETFDQNKVIVLGLGEDNEVKFTVVKETPVSQNYCSDCNCGKKQGTENGLS